MTAMKAIFFWVIQVLLMVLAVWGITHLPLYV